MSIIQVIEQRYAQMGKKEKRIAEYIMKNVSSLGNITIYELAESIEVAPSTITRFCHRLDCESFSDFKMQIHALKEPKNLVKGHLHSLVTSYYDEVIDHTASLVNESLIEEVSSLLLQAKRILIYGLGSSGLSAEEFRMRLTRMGLQASSERDAHMIVMGSQLLEEGDLVIGFSNSGETVEIIQALKNAKASGAKTISFTSVASSSLDKANADIHIYLHNKRFLNEEYFINTQITTLYIIDLITMRLLENNVLKTNMQKTYRYILDYNSNH